jgi:uncharacterized glyoxalase superfamily protein PhnB
MAVQPENAVANPPKDAPRIRPHLIYDDPGAAIEWLASAFNFRLRAVVHRSPDGSVQRAQIEIEDSLITIGTPSVHGQSPRHGVSSMLYIYVDNVDEHYARAKREGAQIVLDLDDQPWGDRRYQASDPEGHQWSFAQRIRDVPLEAFTD